MITISVEMNKLLFVIIIYRGDVVSSIINCRLAFQFDQQPNSPLERTILNKNFIIVIGGVAILPICLRRTLRTLRYSTYIVFSLLFILVLCVISGFVLIVSLSKHDDNSSILGPTMTVTSVLEPKLFWWTSVAFLTFSFTGIQARICIILCNQIIFNFRSRA